VGGSNGKTTTKEMLAGILAGVGATLATRGNLNNHIGVPLTLLRLEPGHRYAVVEMGANHPGEIAALATLAKPAIALVTNAGDEHLEGFGDLEGVARAEGEMYAALGDGGTAVVNADDPFAALWESMAPAGAKVLRFGIDAPADVRAASIQGASRRAPSRPRSRSRSPGTRRACTSASRAGTTSRMRSARRRRRTLRASASTTSPAGSAACGRSQAGSS
jgi:UDP-N-acetylmuramyl pentapeptide synthase